MYRWMRKTANRLKGGWENEGEVGKGGGKKESRWERVRMKRQGRESARAGGKI